MSELYNALVGIPSSTTLAEIKVFNDNIFILCEDSINRLIIEKVEFDFDQKIYKSVYNSIIIDFVEETYIATHYSNTNKCAYIVSCKEISGQTYPIIRSYNTNTHSITTIFSESMIENLSNGTLVEGKTFSNLIDNLLIVGIHTASGLNLIKFEVSRNSASIKNYDYITGIDASMINYKSCNLKEIVYEIDGYMGTLVNK